VPATTRRGVLRKLAAGLLVGVGAATALGSNPPTAEAKITVNPTTNGLIKVGALVGNGVTGVNGLTGTGSGTTNFGVQGISGSSTKITGTYAGVYGTATTQTGSGAQAYGVFGSSDDIGVYGKTSGNSPSDYGVYGVGNGAPTFAGYFVGNVTVTGTINKAAVGFKIDHPLKPDGKYLLHTSIESPDMLNLYNGLATLDETGEALVTLPDWFEALNRDFRYQLTSVGVASPSLYIAQEIAANSFKIAGGVAGQKVSWQLTGVRQDAYANAYRMPIEQDKDTNERGMYLHPELFDKSADFQIGLRHKTAPIAPVM
jgi:hypothetical protein